MLRPRAYAAVCEHLGAGGDALLDHDPRGADDGPARDVRFRRTLRLYREHYESEPPAWAWTADAADAAAAAAAAAPPGSVRIYVKALTGKTFEPMVDVRKDLVIDAKLAIHAERGIPVDQQRLIFDGQKLEDGRALASYGIEAGSILHLNLKLGGC